MTPRSVTTGATLLLGLALAACAGDSEGVDPAVGNTTADLLAAPVGDGMSTPLAVDPNLVVEGGPRVAVTDLGFNSGDPQSVVKVVELSDFGCGYCRQFHEETFPTLREQFIETGMVEWKFVPFITGMFANSLAVTEASECVMEQSADAYVRITGRLWAEQQAWKGSGEPAPLVRGWISELGIDMTSFDSCLSEDRRVPRVASATTLARQLGVRGTPTFVIIGYPPLQGALPLDLFQQILATIHSEETRVRAEAAAARDSAAAADTSGPGR